MADRDVFERHPGAVALLEAAREHLVGKVVPSLGDARLRFETLVAAHVLGVVAREIGRDPGVGDALEAGRAALSGAPDSDAALCEAIDRGAFDDETAAAPLRAWLRARTEVALSAWNPAFLARTRR